MNAVAEKPIILSNQIQKDSSQETIISLLGMLAGSLVVSRINSPLTTWSALLFLLSIHLGTNYLAVRAVSMRTINRQRANIVFSSYLQSLLDGETRHSQKSQERINKVRLHKYRLQTPEEVSLKERIFEFDGVIRWHDGLIIGHCTLGVPLKAVLRTLPLFAGNSHTGSYSSINRGEVESEAAMKMGDSDVTIQALLELFSGEDYILSYSLDYSPSSKRRQPHFYIVLTEASSTVTQLKGWFHALLCASRLSVGLEHQQKSVLGLLKETLVEVRDSWTELLEGLKEAGWDVETGALETKSGLRTSFVSETERR